MKTPEKTKMWGCFGPDGRLYTPSINFWRSKSIVITENDFKPHAKNWAQLKRWGWSCRKIIITPVIDRLQSMEVNKSK